MLFILGRLTSSSILSDKWKDVKEQEKTWVVPWGKQQNTASTLEKSASLIETIIGRSWEHKGPKHHPWSSLIHQRPSKRIYNELDYKATRTLLQQFWNPSLVMKRSFVMNIKDSYLCNQMRKHRSDWLASFSISSHQSNVKVRMVCKESHNLEKHISTKH